MTSVEGNLQLAACWRFITHASASATPHLLPPRAKVRGDKKPYLQVDRIEGLAALAQVAAL
jgi:bifunctional non-homologous end joining protein LigD